MSWWQHLAKQFYWIIGNNLCAIFVVGMLDLTIVEEHWDKQLVEWLRDLRTDEHSISRVSNDNNNNSMLFLYCILSPPMDYGHLNPLISFLDSIFFFNDVFLAMKPRMPYKLTASLRKPVHKDACCVN